MSRTVAANLVFSTDTFNTAFTDINALLFFAKNDAMSANSTEGTTTGNASLTGTFTASNVAVTGSLRGGTLGTPASLNVSTNCVFIGSLVNSTANLSVTALTTLVGNLSHSGNSTVVTISATGNSTVSEVTLGGTNLRINSNVVANASLSFNNTTTIVGNVSVSGNSSIVGLVVTGNSTVTNTYIGGQRLLVNTVANTTFTSNVFINGDLTVTGNSTITISAPSSNWNPSANATYSLGNSTMTWLASLYQPIIYSQITASANGVLLGNTTNRFAAAFTTANTSGTLDIGGNVTVNSTGFTVDATNKRASVNVATSTDAFTVAGTINTTSIVGTNATFTANVTATGHVAGNTVIYANTASVTNTSVNIVDSFPKASFGAAKYVVYIKDATTLIHALEILAVHDGTNVLLTKYGEIFNTSLGTFDISINNANVELQYTSSNAGTNPWVVKVQRTNIV